MPDTLEATRPIPKEVAQDKVITTPETEHDATVASVEHFLAEQNPNGPVARARPTTAETPIPQSPELEAVGAERVGSHEPVLDQIRGSVEEVTSATTHAISSGIKESFGHETDRIGRVEGEGWRQRLAQRIRGKIPFLRKK